MEQRGGKRATMSDVARLAGVSPMTVSNVINGKIRVSQKRRDAVLTAIDALDFKPDLTARKLAKGQPLRIGLVCPASRSSFLSGILMGVIETVDRHFAELDIRTYPAPDMQAGYESAAAMVRRGANGLLLLPPFCDSELAETLVDVFDIRQVTLSSESWTGRLPAIRIDDELAAYEVTAMLLRRGHRNIGFVCFPLGPKVTQLRLAGHRRALSEAGIAPCERLQHFADLSYQAGRSALQYFLGLEQRPSAICANSDELAVSIINAAAHEGLQVPQEMSVVGFDDSPIAEAVYPGITTVRQPVETIARVGTQALIAAIDDSMTSSPTPEFIPHLLVERGSVAEP